MPALTKSVPKYRRHKASGQAVVTLNGIDHYLGPYGTVTSKTAYDARIAEWLANGRQAVARSAAPLSTTQLCVLYLKYATGYYKKDGKCTGVVPGIKQALKYLRKWYGKDPAIDFGPVRLKALRQKMIEDGLSRRYINDQTDRIRRMFKWAAGEQMIGEEVYRALTLVEGLRKGRSGARETAKITCVPDDTVEATLACMQEVVADMVRVQRLTGARPAEICIMRPCDIDRSQDVWVYVPGSHKTEHHDLDRRIFIGPKAQEVLLRYLARDAETCCFRPSDSEAKRRAERSAERKTPLGYGNSPGTNTKRSPKRTAGSKYTTASYRRAIHRACDKAFPHPTFVEEMEMNDSDRKTLKEWQASHRWSPNRLRHTAGTEVRKEFGLEGSQIILGHTSANTSEIYAERDFSKGVEIARKLG